MNTKYDKYAQRGHIRANNVPEILYQFTKRKRNDMASKSRTKQTSATNTPSKLARRKNRGSNGDNPIQAEYESLNHENVCRLIDAVASHGGTVTFGLTRDGGAFFINYWCDGDSEKFWIRPTEEPDARIIDEIEFWLSD